MKNENKGIKDHNYTYSNIFLWIKDIKRKTETQYTDYRHEIYMLRGKRVTEKEESKNVNMRRLLGIQLMLRFIDKR